jgi:hypothetical protein
MALCESNTPLTRATGGCKSQARWLGPDNKGRCSLHQIQEFGHGAKLVKVEGYEPPQNGSAPEPETKKLPSTHAALDELAAQRGVDLSETTTVAEKQAAIEAAS